MSEYGVLARLYDRMMSHVPYSQWVKMIFGIQQAYGEHDNPALFEIGGGTGTLGSILVYEGMDYTGSDISPAMCRAAWDKGLDYICCDCRALPLQRSFDMVFFCFDGINYLSSGREYETAFRELARCLAPKGLFLFDITTEYSSHLYFTEYTDAESFDFGAYIRYADYDTTTHCQRNCFDIFLQDPQKTHFTRHREEHEQWVFSPDTVQGWIPADLFEVVGMWEDYHFSPVSPQAERIHFLLRRRSDD
ncbi:MAG: class I SAM-dependent DNA methyltransferase [Fibrobacterota bacterium]